MKDLDLYKEQVLSPMDLWVEERHGGDFATRFRCQKVLFSGQSKFQHIDVVETSHFGRMLLNDGIVMLSEYDESTYHEMLVHVPLFTHPQPKKVLIIGGGDGGTAREVIRHASVEKCINVEIDTMVVDVCKKYFPSLANALDHPRVDLHNQDGALFVKDTKEKFDVVLVDSTDPLGPAKVLFNKKFYQSIYQILKEGGLLVAQAESPLFKKELAAQKYILESLSSIFPITSLYHYSNVSYPGGLWSFACASKKYHPVKDVKAAIPSQWNLKYYNSEVHIAAFTQPEFIKKSLGHLMHL